MEKMVSKNDIGFTLVEVIVTIVVAGIMMIGLSTTVVGIRLINARSKDAALINSVAIEKVEELRSRTFIQLDDGSYDFTNELPDTITNDRSATYTVSSVPGNASLKEIVVSINYNDFNNESTYEYKTYIGELGVGQY
jgi:prepilin-type N-terminal cleavage/methylation domain-containing protein